MHTYVILNKQFKHILKAYLPHLEIFKYFTRSVTQIWHCFALVSLPYVQNIIFLPVVINLTYLHHKRVSVVSFVDYCLLLTEENSALHSYFCLLRMVYTGMHRFPHTTHRVVIWRHERKKTEKGKSTKVIQRNRLIYNSCIYWFIS